MIEAAFLEREREELAQGLARLRRQQAELARVVAMQEGAVWYVERLIAQAGVDAQAVEGETGGNDAGDQ